MLGSVQQTIEGHFEIQDLIKMRSEIRENTKYFDRIRDLTALRDVGFLSAKIWAVDVGIFCLSVEKSGNRYDLKKKKKTFSRQKQT